MKGTPLAPEPPTAGDGSVKTFYFIFLDCDKLNINNERI